MLGEARRGGGEMRKSRHEWRALAAVSRMGGGDKKLMEESSDAKYAHK